MSAAELVSALGELGFSLNESRAYASLLRESPATGYEVGVRAHIPRRGRQPRQAITALAGGFCESATTSCDPRR